MTDYTPIKDFAVKDNLAATDPQRLIRGQEIQDELNAIAASISTKIEDGIVLPDPVEVRPVDQYFSVPDISGTIQTVDSSTLNFGVSDTSWVFPIDITDPSTSRGWFKLSYTVISRMRHTSTTKGALNNTVTAFLDLYLVNNDTDNIYLVEGRRQNTRTLNTSIDYESVDVTYTDPVIANFITPSSIEALAGQSNTGYSVALDFTGQLVASNVPTSSTVTLEPNCIIYQEIFQ